MILILLKLILKDWGVHFFMLTVNEEKKGILSSGQLLLKCQTTTTRKASDSNYRTNHLKMTR